MPDWRGGPGPSRPPSLGYPSGAPPVKSSQSSCSVASREEETGSMVALSDGPPSQQPTSAPVIGRPGKKPRATKGEFARMKQRLRELEAMRAALSQEGASASLQDRVVLCEQEFQSYRAAARQAREYLAARERKAQRSADEHTSRFEQLELRTICLEDRFEFELSQREAKIHELEHCLAEAQRELRVERLKQGPLLPGDSTSARLEAILQESNVKVNRLTQLSEQYRERLRKLHQETRQWFSFAEGSRKDMRRRDIEVRSLKSLVVTCRRRLREAEMLLLEANAAGSPRQDRATMAELVKVLAESDGVDIYEVPIEDMLLPALLRKHVDTAATLKWREHAESDEKALAAHWHSFTAAHATASAVLGVGSVRSGSEPEPETNLRVREDAEDSLSSSSGGATRPSADTADRLRRLERARADLQQQLAQEQQRREQAVKDLATARAQRAEAVKALSEHEVVSNVEVTTLKERVDGLMEQLREGQNAHHRRQAAEAAAEDIEDLLMYRRMATVLQSQNDELRRTSEEAQEQLRLDTLRHQDYESKFRSLLEAKQRAEDDARAHRSECERMARNLVQRDFAQHGGRGDVELQRQVDSITRERDELRRSLNNYAAPSRGGDEMNMTVAMLQQEVRRLRSIVTEAQRQAQANAAEHQGKVNQLQAEVQHFTRVNQEQQASMSAWQSRGAPPAKNGSGGYLLAQPASDSAEEKRRVAELSGQLEEARREVSQLQEQLLVHATSSVGSGAGAANESSAVAEHARLIQELTDENDNLRRQLRTSALKDVESSELSDTITRTQRAFEIATATWQAEKRQLQQDLEVARADSSEVAKLRKQYRELELRASSERDSALNAQLQSDLSAQGVATVRQEMAAALAEANERERCLKDEVRMLEREIGRLQDGQPGGGPKSPPNEAANKAVIARLERRAETLEAKLSEATTEARTYLDQLLEARKEQNQLHQQVSEHVSEIRELKSKSGQDDGLTQARVRAKIVKALQATEHFSKAIDPNDPNFTTIVLEPWLDRIAQRGDSGAHDLRSPVGSAHASSLSFNVAARSPASRVRAISPVVINGISPGTPSQARGISPGPVVRTFSRDSESAGNATTRRVDYEPPSRGNGVTLQSPAKIGGDPRGNYSSSAMKRALLSKTRSDSSNLQ